MSFALSFSLNAISEKDREKAIIIVDSMLDDTHLTMMNVEIDKTIELSSKALALSSDANYSRGMVRAYYVIGQALFHNQNYNEALSYLSSADKVKDFRKYPSYMAQIYKVKGQIYFYLEMNTQALREFKRALDVVKGVEPANHRDYLTAQIYESFITVYNYADNKEEVLKYLQKDKALLESSDDEGFIFPNKINMYSLMGEYHSANDAPDSALIYLEKSMSLINKYDFKYKSFTLRLLGDVYGSKNQHRTALEYYLGALNNATELGLRSEYPLLNSNIADMYQHLNMTDSAMYYHNRKIVAENDLLRQKVNSIDKALKILIEEEKNITKSSRNKILVASIIATILLGILFSRIAWKRRHKEIVEEANEETEQLKQQLNFAFDEVIELAKDNDPAFMVRFQEVYPVFYKTLIDQHPDLTTTDLKLCAMTYLNISTADIAKYTFVEIRTVQTRRSRLRKKINLPPDTDLYMYLNSLG